MADTMHDSYADTDLFLLDINALRRRHKGQWFYWSGHVSGLDVRIKSFGTGYLQIFTVDGIDQAPPMEMNVKQWTAFIKEALK